MPPSPAGTRMRGGRGGGMGTKGATTGPAALSSTTGPLLTSSHPTPGWEGGHSTTTYRESSAGGGELRFHTPKTRAWAHGGVNGAPRSRVNRGTQRGSSGLAMLSEVTTAGLGAGGCPPAQLRLPPTPPNPSAALTRRDRGPFISPSRRLCLDLQLPLGTSPAGAAASFPGSVALPSSSASSAG